MSTPEVIQTTELRKLDPAVRVAGEVVKGFGRGSKMLGIPTANLPLESIKSVDEQLAPGVYCGWASVSGRGPFKMVMSVGWNPFFENKEKTVEPHLLHEFEDDFYGSTLRLVIAAYLRPEANFTTIEALIATIKEDIRVSDLGLDGEGYLEHRNDPFLCVEQK